MGIVGWVRVWRAELFREGGLVGWLIKTAGGVVRNHPPETEWSSWCKIAFRVWWGGLDFGGLARIGRVVLSVEGGIVGNGRLGWGFGGWNGSGRVVLACVFAGCVCLADITALRGRNRPPGLVGTAGLWGFARIERAERSEIVGWVWDWEDVFV